MDNIRFARGSRHGQGFGKICKLCDGYEYSYIDE